MSVSQRSPAEQKTPLGLRVDEFESKGIAKVIEAADQLRAAQVEGRRLPAIDRLAS
jgi:hypothetical protein